MEIIKKLTLNKTPKDAINGSIAFAMNMMVDDTGSFLSNDIGLTKVSICTHGNERIVGVIPTNKELVILTHQTRNDDNETVAISRIYRLKDRQPVEETTDKWTYEGGIINGSYTYNYKGELIIAIAESGAEHDVPLKCFNLDTIPTYNGSLTYAIEEDIPKYGCNYSLINGSLACGTYTFFIRFKTDAADYTKWFQLTGDIHITEIVKDEDYKHNYIDPATKKPIAAPLTLSGIYVNSNNLSTQGIKLVISIENNKFNEYQIGYIVKRKTDASGRILATYKLLEDATLIEESDDYASIVSVTDNFFLEEIGINELIEAPHQMFNVENIINYNNRLYIANYDEYKNRDLRSVGKNVLIDTYYNDEDNHAADLIRNNELLDSSTLRSVSFKLFIGMAGVSFISTYSINEIQVNNIRVDSNGNVLNDNDILNILVANIYGYDTHARYSRLYANGKITSESGNEISSVDYYNIYLMVQSKSNPSNYDCIYSHEDIQKYQPDFDPEAYANEGDHGIAWNLTIHSVSFKIEEQNNIRSLLLITNGNTYNIATFSSNRNFVQLNTNDALGIVAIKKYHNGNSWRYIVGETYAERYDDPSVIPGTDFSDVTKIIADNYEEHVGSGWTDNDGNYYTTGYAAFNNANSRTLHPYQVYNFFIHFIRKDGSYTNGYNIGTRTFITEEGNIIIPIFQLNQQDVASTTLSLSSDYIGYFITYEEVERNTEEVYITRPDASELVITNAEYAYDLDMFRGTRLNILDISVETLSPSIFKYVQDRENINRLILTSSLELQNTNKGYLLRDISNQYSKDTKILYRLTENIYDLNDKTKVRNDYLPDYYNKQYLLLYGKIVSDGDNPEYGYYKIFVDANIEFVFNHDGEKTTYGAQWVPIELYSKFPTEAMSVKQPYKRVATTLNYAVENGDAVENKPELVINNILSPNDLHDYLELHENYRAKPSKVYVNYNEHNISRFDKTVRRSDVISDESLENRFRHFSIGQYKHILENKGKITNIVGIGFYLIVHTEHSMFVFDRSPKLTKTSQLDIPDTFDIDYQEVMPSNEGFGGLRDRHESIVCKHGYIWYDHINKVIFTYLDGNAGQLSADITNYFKYRNVDTVRFAEDIKHDRLMICCKTSDNKYFTLSYNFITQSFISLHDYYFTHNYRTYGVSYLFNEERNNKDLYIFDDNKIAQYGELTLSGGNSDNGADLFDNSPTGGGHYKSIVDIIFNDTYEVPKVLNSINYVLSTFSPSEIEYIPALRYEKPNRLFSGDLMRIYTDEVDTEDFSISIGDNKLNDTKVDEAHPAYELPAWNKGRWNLNYFRNLVNKIGFDLQTYEGSDDRSLIYGKYFIVRFIFNNDKKVKLDNVDINIDVY